MKSIGKANGSYVRLGATNRTADFETIAELESQKRHISFDEEIYYEVEFSKLDVSPLAERFKSICKSLDNQKLEIDKI
jgi:ATP-dependent DNA helicase RecG